VPVRAAGKTIGAKMPLEPIQALKHGRLAGLYRQRATWGGRFDEWLENNWGEAVTCWGVGQLMINKVKD